MALVLAAGKGMRVGGPKALLLVDGAPLLVAHVQARLADCDRVVVVTRRSIAAQLDTSGWPAERVRVVLSDAPDDEGPAGSIAAAAQQLPRDLAEATCVLVIPVDVRPALPRTVALLF
ncbi:MAG: NTP transferase domain-containing protein, partial [Polyangiales bacterium]